MPVVRGAARRGNLTLANSEIATLKDLDFQSVTLYPKGTSFGRARNDILLFYLGLHSMTG